MDIEIEIGPVGKLNLEAPQQDWNGRNSVLIQYARFAGQEMMAIQKSDDEPDAFELHFLGLVGSGFKSIEEAKESAPAFAKEVFNYLSQMVND